MPELQTARGDESDVDTGTLTVEVRRVLPGFTLDIAFSVPRGLTVLFGPSGAGKSLTLQAIAGLFALDAARVALDGTVWHDSSAGIYLPPQRRHVGYVPQNYALFPHLTVEQNIAFGLKAHTGQERGRQAKQHKHRLRVSELIELMQLNGLERQRPAQLSGGQQQRVALARALAADSRLLLLDEPFSSLDAAVRESLREEMRTFHERVHVPIVLVTHDAAEARMLADTIVVIQQGHVLQSGTPDEVFRSPQTRAVAALVGMQTCWQGQVASIADTPHASQPMHPLQRSSKLITIHTNGLSLYADVPAALALRNGQALDIGIRTDEVRTFANVASTTSTTSTSIKENLNEPTPHMTLVAAEVLRDQPKGTLHSITLLLATGQTLEIPMLARELHDLRIVAGEQVVVGIPASAVHVFG